MNHMLFGAFHNTSRITVMHPFTVEIIIIIIHLLNTLAGLDKTVK